MKSHPRWPYRCPRKKRPYDDISMYIYIYRERDREREREREKEKKVAHVQRERERERERESNGFPKETSWLKPKLFGPKFRALINNDGLTRRSKCA